MIKNRIFQPIKLVAPYFDGKKPYQCPGPLDKVRDLSHVKVSKSTKSRKTRKNIININSDMKFTKESISEVKNAQFSLLIFLYRLYKAILAHFDQNRLKLSRKKLF